MRVALYRRVSSPRQKDGVSLADQDDMCRAFAAQRGWTVVADYEEAGRSAFSDDLAKRIAFQRMLADARARHFDAVLVYKLNRFARKVLIQYQAAAELERCKVEIVSATEPIDRKTASGRLTFGMLAVLAEAQSDQLSEKMRDTRAAEARAGKHVGPIPLGFRRERGMLIPTDLITAVQLAFDLYATRQHSFASVADALNERGWRTAQDRPFTKYQVEEMLKHPAYVGRVRCAGVEHPGQHAAVINVATWHAVQAEITRRASMPDHAHRSASQPALLSGLARCSNCGAPMWRTGPAGGYYRCSSSTTRDRDPRCNLRGVQVAAAEAHVLASLVLLTSDPELIAAAAAQITMLAAVSVAGATDTTKIKEQMRRAGKLYELGLKTDAELERDMAALRRQLASAEEPPAMSASLLQTATDLLCNIPALLAQATTAERRAILQELFDEIYLVPHQAMAVRPTRIYANLLKETDKRFVWWAGWGSNPRNEPLLTSLTSLTPILKTRERFRITI